MNTMIFIAYVWTGSAQAGEPTQRSLAADDVNPNGFLVHAPQREHHSLSIRNVLVVNPGEVTIGQATPRLHTGWRFLGLDFEQTFIDVWVEGWEYDQVMGNRRTGLWLLPSKGFRGRTKGRAAHGLGLEWTRHWEEWGHPGNSYYAKNQAGYWGSQSRETIDRGYAAMMLVWQATWSTSMPITTRLGVGGYGVDLGIVMVIPVNDRVSVVLEQDWVPNDGTPSTLRPLSRFKLYEGVDLDLGVQVPYAEWINERGPSSAQFGLQIGGVL